MCMLVHRGVGVSRAVTVIGGDVDYARLCSRSFRSSEQTVDERGADTVRGRREQGTARVLREPITYVVLAREAQIAECCGKVRKRLADRFAGLRIRHHACQLEVRVREHEPQHFAGHVAGAAEDQGGNARAHVHAAVSELRPPGISRRDR